MFDIELIMQQQARLETERATFDRMWQEVAELTLPRHAHFNSANDTPGSERTGKLYDSHGLGALDQGVSVFESYTMPRGSRWQLLRPLDLELMKSQRVAAWFDTITQRLFARRNDPEAGFVSQTHESVASLLAFGNQSTWVDIRYDQWGVAEGLRYRSEHLRDVVIEEDYQGIVTRTRAKCVLPAREALRKFGRARLQQCPQVLTAADDPKLADRPFTFLHVIMPNPKIEPDRLDWRGKPFVGLYIGSEDKGMIDIGGYRSNPRTYSRLEKCGNEPYGRGRGMDVLPELRQMQDLGAAIMAATELNANRPLAAHEDMLDQNIHYAPNGITYGAIDERGQLLIRPMIEEVDLSGMYGMQEQLHATIDKAFFVDMLMTRQEVKTHVSATETLERKAEKGVLLSPLGRQETEWFSPMLDREIDLMAELGDFDDMPPEVQEAGGAKQVIYDNELNRMQVMDQAAGFFRTAEQVGSIAAFYPDAGAEFAAQFPLARVLPELANINAVPAMWRASDEEQAAAEDQKNQQAELAAMTDLLPAVAKSARDLSVAEGQAGG